MIYTLSKRNFTEHQKNAIWSLWSHGKSLSEIGRQLNKHAGSIFCFLQKYGGIKPTESHRSKKTLTQLEREEISRGLSASLSIRTIAKNLERSPSTISREIKRNGGSAKYRATRADQQAWERAKRPKKCKLQTNPILNDIIADKLLNKWSPEQISGYLKRTYPNDTTMHISHESIYKTLYIQSRGTLKKELLKNLRTQRVMRQSKKFNTKGNARGGIIDAVSIHERPRKTLNFLSPVDKLNEVLQ